MFVYLDKAIADFDQALWTGTGLVHACQTLGNVLQALGRFDESVDWHARAVQAPGDRAELFSGLGTLYAQEQRWSEAIAAYQQTLKLQPTHAEACWNLANIYALLNQSTEALEYRHRALKQSPRWATCQSHFSLGNELMAQNQVKAAIVAYGRALAIDSTFVPAQYNLAVALISQGNYEAAIVAYRRVLELDSSQGEACLGLGQALEQQNQWQEALIWYRRALELAPESLDAFYALGQLLLKQEAWSESLVVYRRAIELKPSFEAYYYLGYALLKQRQVAQAKTAFQQAIDRNPTHAEPYYYLAKALFLQQQWMDVIPVALHAIKRQPNLLEMYGLLGCAIRQRSREQGGLQKLIAYYRQTPLIPAPEQPSFYRQIGDELLQQRQFDGAILFYRLALLQQPDNAVAQTNLKQAFTKRKQLGKTIATRRQRLAENPYQLKVYSQLANLLAEHGEWEEAIALSYQANLLQEWQHISEKHYEFTWDWFSHRIPIWQDHLSRLAHQSGLQALEIACWEGRSTCWLLDHILTSPDSHFTCLDHSFQERFDLNIDRSGVRAKVTKQSGNPLAKLSMLPFATYDLIHLGSDNLTALQQHIAPCWQALKPGGILMVDEYCQGYLMQERHRIDALNQNLNSAIDRFLALISAEAKVLYRNQQILIQKVSHSVS